MKTKIAIKGYRKGSTIPGRIFFEKSKNKWRVKSITDPRTGKIRTALAENETAAILKLLELNEFIENGDNPTKAITLSELSEEFYEKRKVEDVPRIISKNSLEQRIKIFNSIKKEYGFVKLDTLCTTSKLTEIQNFIANNLTPNGSLPTQNTIKSKYIQLNMILNYGIEENYFSQEAINNIYKVKKNQKKIKSGKITEKPTAWNEKDMKFIFSTLDKLPTPNLKMYVELTHGFGLRPEEALGLQWKNFNKKNRTLEIRTVCVYGEFKEIPKSSAGHRILYIPDNMLEILNNFEEKNLSFINKDSLILNRSGFYKRKTNNDKFMDSDAVGKLLKNAFKNTYIEDTGDAGKTKKFRRTFATNAVNAGVDIVQLKYIMGHEDIKTTMIYYSHTAEEIKAAMNKIHSIS